MPYSALYAFGDSLSDAGNVSVLTGQAPVSPPYFKQAYPGGTGIVFSNGPVAVQSLSGQLGLGLLAPSLLGGTDYAYGGAETGDTPQNSGDLRQPLLSLPFQLTQFEAVGLFGNSPAKDALYTLSIGGNDILSILADTSLSVAQQARDVAAAVANESAAVLRLAADGARNLLVFSVPDLGRIPEVTFGLADGSDRPNAATNVRASALAASYNNQLAVALSAAQVRTGIQITTVDLYALTDAALNNPAAYGLNSTAVPVWTGRFDDAKSGILASTDQAVQNQSFFWDDVHPTTAIHNNVANLARAALAPALVYQQDLTTGVTSIQKASAYQGPDLDLHGDYAAITPGAVALFGGAPGEFLHSGAGDDIMVVYSGNNVLVAGGGSNFLVGGTGTDTFYADATGGKPSWNALVNFHAGDLFSVVGWTPGVSKASWTDGNGTALSGPTLRIDLTGKGTVFANATFLGVSPAQAAAFTTSVGAAGSDFYYAVKA